MGRYLWLLLFGAVAALQMLAYSVADTVTPRGIHEVVAAGRGPYCISQPGYYLVLEGDVAEREFRRGKVLVEDSRSAGAITWQTSGGVF